jgi:hypothetical protein
MGRDEDAQSDPLTVVQRSAGIDWCTRILDEGAAIREGEALALRLMQESHERKEEPRRWSWMGFNGWMIPSLRVGWSRTSMCLQTSGEPAASIYPLLRRLPGRTTRLDVQTTVRLSRSERAFGTRFLRRVATTHRPPPQSSPIVQRTKGTDGLWLGRVGRRTGERFVRVYDKGVESGKADAGILWRVELEAKKGLAEELCRKVPEGEDAAEWCLSTCRAQLRSAGFCWPSVVSCGSGERVSAPAQPPAPAHTLIAWWRHSVAPTVPRVLEVYDVAAVLEALGLSEVAQPKEVSGDP